MPESLWVRVTVVIHLALLLLGAIVPGKLEQTLPLGDRVGGALPECRVSARVSQEVEVEAGILVFDGTQ